MGLDAYSDDCHMVEPLKKPARYRNGKFLAFGILQIIYGIAAIVFGSLCIVYRVWSIYSTIGAGIWGGCIFISTGAVLIDWCYNCSRCIITAVFALSVTSVVSGLFGAALYGLDAYRESQGPFEFPVLAFTFNFVAFVVCQLEVISAIRSAVWSGRALWGASDTKVSYHELPTPSKLQADK